MCSWPAISAFEAPRPTADATSCSPAIVGNFALPIAVAALAIIPFLRDPLERLDLATTTTQLTEKGMSGAEWVQLGTSFAAWFGILMVIGVARITRGEVR